MFLEGKAIMEYVLITSEDAKEEEKSINEKVNNALADGYKLYGNPGITIHPKTGTIYYYQALIRGS